jgi:serine-type D-Ala-D-Ala carboxypeptidase (penicillin-binding protein 5/6)
VLEPVVRRRRSSRGRRVVAVLLVAAIAAAVAVIVIERRSGHHRAAASAPVQQPRPVERRPEPKPARSPAVHRVPNLLIGGAVRPHAFRPTIAARAAIVVDRRNGRVLWALRPHRRLPIASTTKIMTAVLALQRLGANTIVAVDPTVTRVPLVREGLRAHERVRAWKLFESLLMYSGNDDALALAIATAGNRRAFVDRMNEEARRLGLRDTRFSTPSGVIDRGNYSSAWDLAALTRFGLRNPRFRQIVRKRIARVPWSPPTFEKVYLNKNALLGSYPGADGVKTGWTTIAGHCLVASATRRGRSVIAVLLHDANMYGDARRLLDFGLAAAG